MNKLMLAAACVLAAGMAFASGKNKHAEAGADYLEGGLSYALFERSVDHADLENCPEQFDPEAVFCRLTLAAEEAHVFVFAYDGDQPLLAVRHYELDDEFLPF